jgi:hypothetical protein
MVDAEKVKRYLKGYKVHVIAFHRELLTHFYSYYSQNNRAANLFYPNLLSLMNDHNISRGLEGEYDVFRAYRAAFQYFTLVDYDGVLAADRDISKVLLCDIMQRKCPDSHYINPRLHAANVAPDMAPYNLFTFVHKELAFLNCTCPYFNQFYNVANLCHGYRDNHQEFMANLPMKTYSLSALRALSSMDSAFFRDEFHGNVIYSNITASDETQNFFRFEEIDEYGFYRCGRCVEWLRREVRRLAEDKDVCSCSAPI